MKQKVLTLIVWLVLTLVSTIARAQFSGADYGSDSARVAQSAESGVVVDVVASTLQTEAPAAARIAGTAFAGALCGRVTDRWNSWAARAGMMTACAAGGERIGAALGSTAAPAITIIVRLDSGRTMAVVQGDQQFQRDQRVWVLQGQGTRIVEARQ
ncbi:MAG: hypothetical protein HYX47_13170 [Burkholderiales bacterium]|nr:hypothetical protein [Burkholderiales bacterium]